MLDRNTFSHLAVVLPRKTDFTLEMLCIHHIIPNRFFEVNYISIVLDFDNRSLISSRSLSQSVPPQLSSLLSTVEFDVTR